jgi:hypothetical protein
VLVAIGVLGELIVGFAAGRVETKMRDGTNALVAVVDGKAASANALAKGFVNEIASANARAKSAEAQVASANAASHQAVAKVANAEARIAEANARAAEAKKEAEAEHLARVKIQQQLSWRDLSPSQRERIRARIAPFAGQKFDVVTFVSEGECLNFANTLYGTALSGGWVLDPNRKWHALFNLVVGVRVHFSVKAGKPTREAAGALADALNAEHVLAAIEPVPETDFPDPAIVGIYVGKNPASMQPIAVPQR